MYGSLLDVRMREGTLLPLFFAPVDVLVHVSDANAHSVLQKLRNAPLDHIDIGQESVFYSAHLYKSLIFSKRVNSGEMLDILWYLIK